MSSSSDDLRVSFPAAKTFQRIGRVFVGGLASRLDFDVSAVEELRCVTDHIVEHFEGDGRVTITAQWTPATLEICFENALGELCDPVPVVQSDLVSNVNTKPDVPGRIVIGVRRVRPEDDDGHPLSEEE